MTRIKPTVAVVIPLYNKGPHIDRAMQTVLRQTVPVNEIIVVDDGSSDDGLDRVRAVNDPRVSIIRRTEPGPGGYAARNVGIKAARSEWIAFLDADDTWRGNAIEEVHKLASLADDGVGTLFTAYDRDYGDAVCPVTAFAKIMPNGSRRFDFDDFVDAWLVAGHSPMWTSAVVARRSTLIEVGMFPEGKCKRGGDKDTWLRLLWKKDALGSPSVTASYHRDAVNMVTKSTSMNHYPFLCETLKGFLPTGNGDRDFRIRQLINFEVFESAKEAYRNEARVDPVLYRGFDWRLNLKSSAQMMAMRWLPQGLIASLRGLKIRMEHS